MTDYFYPYASLQALVNESISVSPMKENDRASRNPDSGRNWNGASWADASAMAQNGDLEGAKRLAPAMLKAVNAMLSKSPRLDPVYQLDGGRWIDVARYVKGEPECWGDMVEDTPMLKRGATVIINCSVSSRATSSDYDKLGISIGSAILGLQAQGYAVTLYIAEKINGDGQGALLISAPVNPGGGPLDISHMSTVLRPWFLRRIIFSLQEHLPATLREKFGIDSGSGYGRPCPIDTRDIPKIAPGSTQAVIVNVATYINMPDVVAQNIIEQITGGN
jgi:hypothetical protein